MSNRTIQLLIILGGTILFVPFLGITNLFDWDEVNFAECAREMVVSGNYARVQVGFLPFWEKPPLFFWLQALAMNVFGVNAFAARLPNALAGIVTLLVLFNIGKKFYSQRVGLLWVLAYAGSFLPHFYFKSGIIDPIFNLFIFLSIYQLFIWTSIEKSNKSERYRHALLGGIYMGFAILTKGPVALLIVGLCGLVYWIMSRKWQTFKVFEILLYAVLAILISSFWYMPETLMNGFWFLEEFIDYQYGLAARSEATGHEQPFWYHPVVLLLGCFPASIYFLGSISGFFATSFKKLIFLIKRIASGLPKKQDSATEVYSSKSKDDNPIQKNFVLWMKILFWVTLILFSIVKAKIIHYSSLCYFPLTFLAVHYIDKVYQGEVKYASWLNILFIVIGTLVGLLLIIVSQVNNLKETVIPYIDDEFAVANLDANVYWSGFEFLVGVLFLGLVFYAIFFANKKSIVQGANALFIATLIVLQLTIYIFIPKIEQYSQKAAIDFMQEVQDEDAYVTTLGYRSYVHYFYAEVTPAQAKSKADYLLKYFGSKEKLDSVPPLNRDSYWNTHLLNEKIDRPAYFITKIDRLDKYPEVKKHKKIGEKNGFILYKREKK